MTWIWAIFTFVNLWCIMLFAVLPWEIARAKAKSVGETYVRPDFMRVALITSLVTMIITTLLAILLNLGIISLSALPHP